MHFWDDLRTGLSAAPGISLIAFLIAVIPSFLLSNLIGTSTASVPSTGANPIGHRPLHLPLIGFLGGMGGAFVAFNSLFFWLDWECAQQPQPCNSAQGDMGLIYLLPILTVLGVLIAQVWTRLSLLIPEHWIAASVFRYSGPHRIFNWLFAIAVQLLFWPALTYLTFLFLKQT